MRRRPAALLAAGLAVAALAAGCGGDDDEGGGGDASGGAVTISDDARIEGADGRKIAEEATNLLEAENGEDPCYELVASDYVESLGGPEGCARKMGPIATGPLEVITAARALPGGETGEARVESGDGSRKQTIKFAKTVAGEWRVDGLGGS